MVCRRVEGLGSGGVGLLGMFRVVGSVRGLVFY